MKTFWNIFYISFVWFVVWGIFLVLQGYGFDYINTFTESCLYFAVVIAVLYTFFAKRIRDHADNFSLEEIGVAAVSVVLAVAIYTFLDSFVIPGSMTALRSSLPDSLKINNFYLITKAFDIMFQQAFFIVSIDYLFSNGLSLRSDVLLFGLYIFLMHIPLIFVQDGPMPWIFTLASLFAGMIFAYLITTHKHGFIWSYIIHFSFYVLIGVGYWTWIAAGI